MLEFWFADENIIFSSAIILMLALGLLQVVGLGDFGPDIDGAIDIDADIDAPGDGLLGLLGLGRLPLMILLVLFLALFGLTGMIGQTAIEVITGGYLTAWLAAPAALLAALPLTGLLARPLARILPRDETTAVTRDSLVGRFATISVGKAETGSPARAHVRDVHGQSHNIMVEPDNAGQILHAGEDILLVKRKGGVFRAISRGDKSLPRLDN